MIENPRSVAQRMLDGFVDLPVIDCGPIANGRGRLRAIYGMTATQSSFKSILGFGLLLLAYERGLLERGQTVIDSTSGSLGMSLALAGKILGNPRCCRSPSARVRADPARRRAAAARYPGST